MILLINEATELFDEIVNTWGEEIPEDILEKIEGFVKNLDESESYKEALDATSPESDEDGIIEALRKVVFRDGKRTVVQKKKMKSSEKLARAKAAKKAGAKRKGKHMKASAKLKLKKSLKKAKA